MVKGLILPDSSLLISQEKTISFEVAMIVSSIQVVESSKPFQETVVRVPVKKSFKSLKKNRT